MEKKAHRIFRQIIRGSSVVDAGDVLLQRIGELFCAIVLRVGHGGIGIALGKREWRRGGRVGRRG